MEDWPVRGWRMFGGLRDGVFVEIVSTRRAVRINEYRGPDAERKERTRTPDKKDPRRNRAMLSWRGRQGVGERYGG